MRLTNNQRPSHSALDPRPGPARAPCAALTGRGSRAPAGDRAPPGASPASRGRTQGGTDNVCLPASDAGKSSSGDEDVIGRG